LRAECTIRIASARELWLSQQRSRLTRAPKRKTIVSMDQAEFERRVLKLWTATRVPMTRANVQAFTKASRQEVDQWMGEMVSAGLADVQRADAPDALWSVRGSTRSANGTTQVAIAEKLETLGSQVAAEPVRAIVQPDVAAVRAITFEKKSPLLGGALSFFFGPFGWLYSAPSRESVPAIVLWILAHSALTALLPHTWVAFLFTLASIGSGFFGAAYTMRYNQTGRRAPLFTEDTPQLPSGDS
jgi:hypothetical protein